MPAKAKPQNNSAAEEQLLEWAASCSDDPLQFVLDAFPWGEPGELKNYSGPRKWQRKWLRELGEKLKLGHDVMPILRAICSGNGPGKSALIGFIVMWALSTFADTKIVLTANTQQQMRTKTWPEIAKWYRMCITKHWFSLQGESIISKQEDHAKTWRCDAVTWTDSNLAAFAGLHNSGRRLLILYDEASEIADGVWETSEGALTDERTEIMWFAFGNGTLAQGKFFECFNGQRDRWDTLTIDSRDIEGTNKDLLDSWVSTYGEDSDFVRVHVKGEFPRAGSMQFIGHDVVNAAMSPDRDVQVTLYDPFIMSLDVSRFGEDASVICFRRGRDARSMPMIKMRGLDIIALSARVAELYFQHKPDALFVDEGGIGGGVVDRLRQLKVQVIGIQFGGSADRVTLGEESACYANKRAEMWGNMREWLKGGAIPNDRELLADLTGVRYGYTIKQGRDAIILEKKEDMKKRGLASPDSGDALCLSFAYPVGASDHTAALSGRNQHEYLYDPLSRDAVKADMGASGGQTEFKYDPRA